jgi:SAM-dependent methyltransferase
MNESNKRILRFYSGKLAEHGFTTRAFDWSRLNSQRRRFELLSGILPLKERRRFSVLDVGCGYGDLYDFLAKKGFRPDYTGVDIMERFIAEAKRRRPFLRFIAGDFLKIRFWEKFDFILCSGALSYKIPGVWEWNKKMIRKFMKTSARGVAFNLTSLYTDAPYKNGHTFYADPAEVFTFCKSLARRVVLLHHYMPNDFTVYMFKDNFK